MMLPALANAALYELRDAAVARKYAGVIGIVSINALELNPSLCMWLIDGHAALDIVPRDPRVISSVRNWLQRYRRSIIASETIRITHSGVYMADNGTTVDISGEHLCGSGKYSCVSCGRIPVR